MCRRMGYQALAMKIGITGTTAGIGQAITSLPYKFVRLSCVYKIKIGDKVVHVGRSDTCKKHGGAEKVRKAIVNLLNLTDDNTSVPKTKYWEEIRLRYRPNSTNIKIGIIKTNAIKKTYIQETT